MAKKKASGPEDILATPSTPGMVPPPAMMPAPAMMPPINPAMAYGQPAMPQPMQPNPMFAMMQMMQAMMGNTGVMPGGQIDPAAVPFAGSSPAQDTDTGLDSDIIRPVFLKNRIKEQQGLPLGSVLDSLCLTNDRKNSLGGVPKGCTIALAGPPGKGKTRSSLAGLAKVALSGVPVAYVIAEEGFYNPPEFGRDDLCSRMTKIGMQATGLGEEEFASKVLANMFVMQSQYHRGKSWDDFVGKYR
ncbi:MAG: hypothetical protein ACK52L_22340, partial [Pirellula sp.]